MLNRYFRSELEFLREFGREFALEYPDLAPALLEAGSDPDVERILEGTAFLTGAIRQKLEDDLPELTQTLIQMLWPHYLRPVPSVSIVEFYHQPQPGITSTENLRAGEVELDSVPVDGTRCRFRTCYDVAFNPLQVSDVRLESQGRGALRVTFDALGNADLGALTLDPLRLHLHGDQSQMCSLRQWLLLHTDRVDIEVPGRRVRRAILPADESPVRPVGFGSDEGLFPYPRYSFLGYRLIQEYFTLAQKFLFLDVVGLEALRQLEPEGSFDVVFRFGERPPEDLQVSVENVRLHCTPVVNLFERDAVPIRLDHKRASYLLRAADPEPDHFEVHSVESVTGFARGTSKRQEYAPFFSFRSKVGSSDGSLVYYKLRRTEAIGRPNSDCHLSFVSLKDEAVLPDAEIASVELRCTNRRIAEELRPGDINVHTDRSPQFAEFHNITPLTPSFMPPLGGDFHWRLISHLGLNFASLADADALKSMLALYDFTAVNDRQAALTLQRRVDAIREVKSAPGQRIFQGSVVRGVHTAIAILEDGFSSEGEMYLFASILDEFLALYMTVNSYSQLTVRGIEKGGVYEWPPRVGSQFTL